MIYGFMGEIVTEKALEERISDEVDRASFDTCALACYILAHDENVDSFDGFNSNNIDEFDDWANEIIEKAIFSDFQPADFDELGYNSEEELEENASDNTSWKMDWSMMLYKFI